MRYRPFIIRKEVVEQAIKNGNLRKEGDEIENDSSPTPKEPNKDFSNGVQNQILSGNIDLSGFNDLLEDSQCCNQQEIKCTEYNINGYKIEYLFIDNRMNKIIDIQRIINILRNIKFIPSIATSYTKIFGNKYTIFAKIIKSNANTYSIIEMKKEIIKNKKNNPNFGITLDNFRNIYSQLIDFVHLCHDNNIILPNINDESRKIFKFISNSTNFTIGIYFSDIFECFTDENPYFKRKQIEMITKFFLDVLNFTLIPRWEIKEFSSIISNHKEDLDLQKIKADHLSLISRNIESGASTYLCTDNKGLFVLKYFQKGIYANLNSNIYHKIQNNAVKMKYYRYESLQLILQLTTSNQSIKGFNHIFKGKLLYHIAKHISKLHASKKYHGNIHPSNILIDSLDSSSIIKFDLIGEIITIIKTKFLGSFNYLAPEFLKDFSTSDYQPTEKGDIYSFGLLLFSVATESLVYHKNSSATELYQIFSSIKSSSPEIPAGICLNHQLLNVMYQCTSFIPEERPTIHQVFSLIGDDIGNWIDLFNVVPYKTPLHISNTCFNYENNIEPIFFPLVKSANEGNFVSMYRLISMAEHGEISQFPNDLLIHYLKCMINGGNIEASFDLLEKITFFLEGSDLYKIEHQTVQSAISLYNDLSNKVSEFGKKRIEIYKNFKKQADLYIFLHQIKPDFNRSIPFSIKSDLYNFFHNPDLHFSSAIQFDDVPNEMDVYDVLDIDDEELIKYFRHIKLKQNSFTNGNYDIIEFLCSFIQQSQGHKRSEYGIFQKLIDLLMKNYHDPKKNLWYANSNELNMESHITPFFQYFANKDVRSWMNNCTDLVDHLYDLFNNEKYVTYKKIQQLIAKIDTESKIKEKKKKTRIFIKPIYEIRFDMHYYHRAMARLFYRSIVLRGSVCTMKIEFIVGTLLESLREKEEKFSVHATRKTKNNHTDYLVSKSTQEQSDLFNKHNKHGTRTRYYVLGGLLKQALLLYIKNGGEIYNVDANNNHTNQYFDKREGKYLVELINEMKCETSIKK